ncbi:hypothetical protein RB200_19750 [Streptomyces sp. PmtG]
MWFRRRDLLVDTLQHSVRHLTAERDAARAEAAAQRAAAVRTAGRHTHLVTRLALDVCVLDGYRARIARLARACGRYRDERDRARRDVARLQARLDDAVGLNQPAIADGALWQHRRLDKPHPTAKETTP